MSWRISREESRQRYRAKFDRAETERYDSSVGRLDRDEREAYLADLRPVVGFEDGTRVLDVGSGTGTMCAVLVGLAGLSITALEPAPAMLEKLRSKPELKGVRAVEGFCDSTEDRAHFDASAFDVIVSRQVANGLFDPVAAFENWSFWLAPGGAIVLIDGLYPRTAWGGVWEEEVDVLPLSAHQTTALVPYLLERSGLRTEHVGPMPHVNALASTVTPRYLVVARKADASR